MSIDDTRKSGADDTASVLGLSPVVRASLIVGGPLVGLILGYYLPTAATWLAALPWIPMRGPLRLIAALDQWWASAALMATGLVLGALFALAAITGALRLVVTDRMLRLDRDGDSRTVDRGLVAAVFLDGPELVVLDRASRQLVRERHDTTSEAITRAMRAHGYPWTGRDPHERLYRRWTRAAPDLPAPVNAVLLARETALREKVRQDARELHEELQNLGYVVRDDGHRQYWRPLVRS